MKKLIVCGLVLSMLLCGCGSKPAETTAPQTTAEETTVATTAAPTTEPATVPTTAPTEPVPEHVNPLTGEALEEVNDQRPFAVMLNNHSHALPQCGISHADIIYEILAEGSITRLSAYFTDIADAGPIGPVRSLRAYYLHIMRGYDALCIHAGGSAEATELLKHLCYEHVNGLGGPGAGYFYRDSWRRENRGYEHSLFVEGADLLKGAADGDLRTTRHADKDYGLLFDDNAPFGGEEANEIVAHFRDGGKTTKFTYDADKGAYSVYQQGQDLIDGNTDEKVLFRNVLVLFADTSVMDGEGHLKVQTTGEGSGYYARDGKLVEIKWSRASETDSFRYEDLQGNQIPFGVGKSYIAVVPTGSPVEFGA